MVCFLLFWTGFCCCFGVFFLREIGESWFVNSDFSLLSHVSHSPDLTVMFLFMDVFVYLVLIGRSADKNNLS